MSSKLKVGFYDEFGRPFVIIAGEKQNKNLTGNDVIKSNITAAKNIASILRTSLGPKGMDKMMIDEDLDIIVTNDGATILENMDVDHEVAKIMVELSKSQDIEVGDGTTSVIVLAGALLEEAEHLMRIGIHPIRVADGFEIAAKYCLMHLEHISEKFPVDLNNLEPLIQASMTALGSKIVSKCKRKFAEITVKAVMNVADLETKEANLKWIRLIGINGGSLEDATLVEGVVLDRKFSHPQMPKIWENSKVALIVNAIEMPKVQRNIKLELENAKGYQDVQYYEDTKLKETIRKVKDTGATILVCLNGFDEKVGHMLLQNGLAGIQRAIVQEMESLSCATGAKIVPRIDDLTEEKLGFAGLVREVSFGSKQETYVLFEKCAHVNTNAILLRSPNPMVLDEAKRSIHDALCVVRNIISDPRIVYGGGAAELSCAIAVSKEAVKYSSVEQYAFQSFANALESIPLALAENSGYNPITALTEIKALHVTEKNPIYGIDCMETGTNDMKTQNVIDTLHGKKQQILIVMDVVKMILKIDQVRVPDKEYGEYNKPIGCL